MEELWLSPSNMLHEEKQLVMIVLIVVMIIFNVMFWIILITQKKKRYDVGQWAIAKFVFSKKKVNYYLCQIVEVTTENKLVIQFYREQLPSLRVFEQIQPKETHDEDVIVELIPKTNVDIMCGTKVKLMGIDLKYKCV